MYVCINNNKKKYYFTFNLRAELKEHTYIIYRDRANTLYTASAAHGYYYVI